MPAHPEFTVPQLEALSQVLANIGEGGLTGTEIGGLLHEVGIADAMPGGTKWRRLLLSFQQQQQGDRCGNKVLAFVQAAMQPVRFIGRQNVFDLRRAALNEVLCFAGLEVGVDGHFRPVSAAKTLTEADQRARRLRDGLHKRGVHPDVLKFCQPELLVDNYFHAVLEATKSVADKIKTRTGLTDDGADLVDAALSLGSSGIPLLAFNSLQTKSERSEQTGLSNLMKGMFGTFRNTTAHEAKIHWAVSEQDAMDLLTLASFLHRRLDAAARTPRQV